MKEATKQLARLGQKVRDTAFKLNKRVSELDEEPNSNKCIRLIETFEETLEEVKEQLKNYKDGLS